MVNPFKNGMLEQACPMENVLGSLVDQLNELKLLKEAVGEIDMAPS